MPISNGAQSRDKLDLSQDVDLSTVITVGWHRKQSKMGFGDNPQGRRACCLTNG